MSATGHNYRRIMLMRRAEQERQRLAQEAAAAQETEASDEGAGAQGIPLEGADPGVIPSAPVQNSGEIQAADAPPSVNYAEFTKVELKKMADERFGLKLEPAMSKGDMIAAIEAAASKSEGN
jgi:hypothetical protein